jgi:hypothetical protein
VPVGEVAAEILSELTPPTALVVHHLRISCEWGVSHRCLGDLDHTIEDIDVGEHRAVLGWGRPRRFQAHILHLYANDFR